MFLHRYPPCGEDVHESIEHVMLKCLRCECPRHNFGTQAPNFHDFVRQIATASNDTTALLLASAPLILFILQEMGGFPFMASSHPSYCFVYS
jgi:hypothetical protein